MASRKRWAVALYGLLTGTALFAGTGPSSSEVPYLVPTAAGVEFTSILTTGDVVKKKHKGNETYRMVGVPDGLGAFDNGDGTITVLMNHELRPAQGAVRDHGARGAFVSEWQIRKSDLKVLNGQDLMQQVRFWDPGTHSYIDGNGFAFSRFCSADLAAPTAYFNAETGKGFSEGRIFLNGEEDSPPPGRGRAMAHLASGRQHGTSYELPVMGRHSWENLLACPFAQDKTIVIGNEDGNLNKVFVFVGEKREEGSPIEMAGLSDGTLYEIKIPGYTNDDPDTGFKEGAFQLVLSGGTTLARPEDGAWDTVTPNRYYFVTTATVSGNSRLWRLTFEDITKPELGGTIKVMVDGNKVPSPQIKMMDNVTVDTSGNVYMLEDVGNNARLGRVWKFDPLAAPGSALTQLGIHDASFFATGGARFLTQDEESSGIIEVTGLFQGVGGYDTANNRYFLIVVQAHFEINSATPHGFDNPDELVEGGQLLMMKVPR